MALWWPHRAAPRPPPFHLACCCCVTMTMIMMIAMPGWMDAAPGCLLGWLGSARLDDYDADACLDWMAWLPCMDAWMDGWMLRHGRPVVRSRLHAAPSDRPPAATAGCARLRVAACGVLPACSRVAVTLAPPPALRPPPSCVPPPLPPPAVAAAACMSPCVSVTHPTLHICVFSRPTHPPPCCLPSSSTDTPTHSTTPLPPRRAACS